MSLGPETVQLSGAINEPGPLEWGRLRSLPEHSATVLLRCSTCDHKDERHDFTGVRLLDLLAPILGYPADDSRRLRLSVVVSATDGYAATIAWGEIDPNFGNQPVMLAWHRDGAALPAGYGPLQLVVPGDEHSGRCVHGIAFIVVIVPLTNND